MNLLHLNAALQTTRASRWELLLVRLFGASRVETDDDGRNVVLRKWRGRSYMIDHY